MCSTDSNRSRRSWISVKSKGVSSRSFRFAGVSRNSDTVRSALCWVDVSELLLEYAFHSLARPLVLVTQPVFLHLPRGGPREFRLDDEVLRHLVLRQALRAIRTDRIDVDADP